MDGRGPGDVLRAPPADVFGCHLGTLGTSLVVWGCPEDPGHVISTPMGSPWMSLGGPRMFQNGVWQALGHLKFVFGRSWKSVKIK